MIDQAAVEFYRDYEPTVEDLLAIQEYHEECLAVAERAAFKRGEVCQCDGEATVAERVVEVLPLEAAVLALCN